MLYDNVYLIQLIQIARRTVFPAASYSLEIMALQIYNTLTRQKEEFTPLEPGKVRMYVCGPTVYADAHVGHAMAAIVFDMVRRYLTYRGYEVFYATNFTDVDDKIIRRANRDRARSD